MKQSIYNAQDALFLSPDLLGGKAANLAWMTREGFAVPAWWVITTAAFSQLLNENGLADFVENALSGFSASSDLSQLEPIAAEIRAKILAATIPKSLAIELEDYFGALTNTYFAVRSSVLGEDAQGASFAGQMDSYLFQRGLNAIKESLLQVCASAFNTRALHYRLSKNIALTDIRAAVIVQEMIEGEVSGVMFTAHPTTGSRQHALISAAWGVGEGIGQVMTALRRHGLADNTLVVFTSDNGGERFSDNWPLVGGKMDLTEGGIRVPWIAHWPAAIAPGGVSAQQCLTMDWSATMLDAAGVLADAAYPLDGISLLPVLKDPTSSFRRPLHWRMNHRGQRALRDGDWKYLRVDGHDYLFNIPADERERANQAGREPARLAAMRAAWEAWEATMPPIPADATVSLGYSVKDMPQR